MPPSPSQQIQRTLWQHVHTASEGQIYVILDGARDQRIYPNLLLSGARHECLYRGDLPEVLLAAAPHLLELQPNAAFTNWLFQYGWGRSWGIFLSSRARIRDLQRHFRQFLTVKDAQGKRLYFRYYDPRVLRVYLPTCTRAELDFVFGPVDQFFLEDWATQQCQVFTRHEQRLRQTMLEYDTLGTPYSPST
ncbi:MAG TPA: DUF4123 domain-containing protein [Rhodothermales bacterium]|nr:DUF4123 domain-containing protein [Rhodothermales bacterium]